MAEQQHRLEAAQPQSNVGDVEEKVQDRVDQREEHPDGDPSGDSPKWLVRFRRLQSGRYPIPDGPSLPPYW